ncbi:MAG: YihY/virulence factor BrkB family protein [Burkholderiaceae bacterium]
MPDRLPLVQFARDFWRKLKADNVFNGAAALGFYLTLAIFPAMIVMMAAIPYLPIERVDQAIMDLLRQAMPGDAAQVFTGVVADVTSERRGGLLSFGLVAALWAASTGMYAIMQQLNVTYDVGEGRPFLRARATALGLSLMFIGLVLGSLSLVVLGGMIQDWIGAEWGNSSPLLTFFAVFRWLVIAIALVFAFALIYYLAPNVKERFRFLTPGSVVAAALLVVASLGFSLYAGHFADYDATYGTIGAVIVLMLWLYIAGLVILVGSVINVLLNGYAERKE